MPSLSGDRQLLARFRRGDSETLAAVYQQYSPVVAAFLARGFAFNSKGRLLQFRGYHQPFDLENALQETFARAFSQRARLAYDGFSPYKSYLMAIARNLVLSELRRREMAVSQLAVEPMSGAGADSEMLEQGRGPDASGAGRVDPSAEADFLRQELTCLYREFVAQLGDRDCLFFVARFEQRLTQVSAGQRAGLSHMQARTLEKKLRKRFLRFMHSHGYLEGYPKKAVPVPS